MGGALNVQMSVGWFRVRSKGETLGRVSRFEDGNIKKVHCSSGKFPSELDGRVGRVIVVEEAEERGLTMGPNKEDIVNVPAVQGWRKCLRGQESSFYPVHKDDCESRGQRGAHGYTRSLVVNGAGKNEAVPLEDQVKGSSGDLWGEGQLVLAALKEDFYTFVLGYGGV